MNPAKSHAGEVGPQTVCLVDDDPLIRTLFARVIQRAGCNVIVASSATEAENILAEQPVNIVISDLMMPDSTDGENLLRKISQDYPRVPVCMMSGNLDLDTREKLIGLGAIACILKPFTADIFSTLLADIELLRLTSER